MFEDIRVLSKKNDASHFMATIVGLRRDIKKIVTDQYRVVEVVDGQQRLTTLIILLKAIEKKLNRELTTEDKLAKEVQELLIKQDNISLILLRTNHDKTGFFVNYLRQGKNPPVKEANTLGDREILEAIHQCEAFVDEWPNRIELLSIIKNQLTFILHEIDDEAAVYTVFEVLNNRGLNVSPLDRLKSTLMSIAFQDNKGNVQEHIAELHSIWGEIYETVGLRQGLNTEALRFAATLSVQVQVSKPFGEEKAVETLFEETGLSAKKAIEVSKWLLEVTAAVDRFWADTRSEAVTEIQQARLLAVAIVLRGFAKQDEKVLLELWERTSFRIFGLCGKDARTGVGEYVRLAWDIVKDKKKTNGASVILERIKKIGGAEGLDIEAAIDETRDSNCYEGWEEQLRYLLFRYEEYLAAKQGQKFTNEQWNHIWEGSAAESVEHIFPQSLGSSERVEPGKGVFVHRLGNLMLLPPGLNSKLKDQVPKNKADAYINTGLLSAVGVATTIKKHGWTTEQIVQRENQLLDWIKTTWA